MKPCMKGTRQKLKHRDRAVKQSGCNNVESFLAYVCIKTSLATYRCKSTNEQSPFVNL